MRNLRAIRRLYSLAAAGLVAMLLAACGGTAPTPTITPTLVPSSTPPPTANIQVMVEMTLTALAPTETPGPTVTPTETPVVITLEPLLGQSAEPPLEITLPEGWIVAENDALIMGDVDNTIRTVPFVAYSGPITGGVGTIVLLWGFPNVATTADGSFEPDLWSDGLRLLRFAILTPDCNVGTDLKRSYRIGLLSAVGTQFAAVDCADVADTRGWFAGLREGGLNFIFYAYADPIEAMDTGSDDLQAILDTVRFNVVIPTPEATPGD